MIASRKTVLVGLVILCVVLKPGSRATANPFPRPDHVLVVVEENRSFNAVIGSPSAPYINALTQVGALMTQSYGVEHPSQPNYLDLFSGSNQGVTTNDPVTQPLTTANLGASLIASGLSFAGYAEDLPGIGSTVTQAGDYVRKHNPWVNWQGSAANAVPDSANLPFTMFPTDFAKLPTVSFVVPNQLNDMHSGTVAQGDAWLETHIDPFVQWAKTDNSLLVLTWDEDDDSSNNHIPTLFVGPMIQPGVISTQAIDHFNVLRTIEDLYGLPYAGQSAVAAPITGIWSTARA